MRNKVLFLILVFLLVSLLHTFQQDKESSSELMLAKSFDPQSTKKPKYDYMSTFLSRDTKPLGLKEDLALKKLFKQSSIKWAIRAGEGHIFD